MVTTTKEVATPPHPGKAPSIDDFRSLLAAVPASKADSLKERIYDWLEKRENDAEVTVEKAKARASIVEEQNRIVRMELQDIENDRLTQEAAATRRARAGLFAEAMSALNISNPTGTKEGEENSLGEDHEDHGVVPADYQQPTESSATMHPLQPLGANIGKKMYAGDTTALDIFIKELLDEVMQLREGASANVARIMLLEDELQSVNDALATQRALLDETLVAKQNPYIGSWEPVANTTQGTSQYAAGKFGYTPVKNSWVEDEEEQEPRDPSDSWMRDDTPSLRSRSPARRSLSPLDATPVRGYLDDDASGSPHIYDACFKKYADMMLSLQLKGSGEPIAYDEIPWPVLPYAPADRYPVPRWRARYADKEQVDKFVAGFLVSKHAETWRGSLRDDWLDLLEYTYEVSVKGIVERMVSFLD
jgi:hypothetical protein